MRHKSAFHKTYIALLAFALLQLIHRAHSACVTQNGIREAAEECDDGNDTNSKSIFSLCDRLDDGCTYCLIDTDYTCSTITLTSPSVCVMCGNEVVEGMEECDDGNASNGDGCSSKCKIEDGFTCGSTTLPTPCCSSDHFYDATTHSCLACHSFCATCSGATYVHYCTSCLDSSHYMKESSAG